MFQSCVSQQVSYPTFRLNFKSKFFAKKGFVTKMNAHIGNDDNNNNKIRDLKKNELQKNTKKILDMYSWNPLFSI